MTKIKLIKDVVKESKIKFNDYKISICRDSYSKLLIIKVKFDEEISYYGGDNLGYVIFNGTKYNEAVNFFKTNPILNDLDIRVVDIIENSKTMLVEFD